MPQYVAIAHVLTAALLPGSHDSSKLGGGRDGESCTGDTNTTQTMCID